MQTRNPAYREVVTALFEQAPFLAHLGVACTGCGPGWCEAAIVLAPFHNQHHGQAHAGVQATLADHAAGAAATTLIEAGQQVVTAEFKLNLLRADVLRAGRVLIVVEATVYAGGFGIARATARGLFTLAVQPAPGG